MMKKALKTEALLRCNCFIDDVIMRIVWKVHLHFTDCCLFSCRRGGRRFRAPVAL